MKKRTRKKSLSLGGHPSFNWQLQDEAPRAPEPLTDSTPSRPRRGWFILAACALLTLVIGYWAGQWLTQRAEANLSQVEAEIAQAIRQQDAQPQGALKQPLSTTVSATTAAFVMAQTDTNVTLLELDGTLALVDLVVNNPQAVWFDQPYRVARIMRQDAAGWKAVLPLNTFWNDHRTLDTPYFHFEFSQRNEREVREIAPQLDELYLRLHADLGISVPKRADRMNIIVAVIEGSDARVTDLRYNGNTLIVPPPELLPRPLNLSNAETLRQAIAFPLTVKLFNASQSQLPDACNWRAVREGIGLWLRWEGHTLPSRRHWEYESVIEQWSKPTSLPRLDDLLSIPRDCWQPPPLTLDAGIHMPRNELAATLIEYMVVTYGRQFIPIVLHGIDHYANWDEFAQVTVQHSADDLETGWRTYLQSRTP